MATNDTTPFRERIQFFNGERLFASDLQDLEAFSRQIRWLHNQSLHQPGVGSGFAVTGNVGDREVVISPGYALDSLGREIILTQNEVLPIPPVADNGAGGSVFFYLTVSYPNDSDLKPSETRDGICLPKGVVRLREEPVFCWVLLSDSAANRQPADRTLKDLIRKQLYLVIAQIEVFNCQLKQPVSTAQRRSARPAKQPHIACGMDQTPKWTFHNYSVGDHAFQPSMAGLELYPRWASARIDTSSAGFRATPIYEARIAGPRLVQPTVAATGRAQSTVALIDALVSIASAPAPTPQEFTVQIYIFVARASRITSEESAPAPRINLPKWKVAWIGIES
jgi:hypothetical protein